MDPLLAEWLRAALAFLFGAVIAAAGQRWAFRNAMQLQDRDRQHRDAAFVRALAAEVDENLRRIGQGSEIST